MSKIEILWLDDDSPSDGEKILNKLDKSGDIELFTAQSCEEAEKFLNSREEPPQWAIVDLIVPQGKWNEGHYFRIPGIKYIEHLKTTYQNRINVLAFSILINPEIEKKIISAGAIKAFMKASNSFGGIIDRIKTVSKGNGEFESI